MPWCLGCRALCRSRAFATRYVGNKKDRSGKVFKIKINLINVCAIFMFPVSLIRLEVPGDSDCVPLLPHQTGSSPGKGVFLHSPSLSLPSPYPRPVNGNGSHCASFTLFCVMAAWDEMTPVVPEGAPLFRTPDTQCGGSMSPVISRLT